MWKDRFFPVCNKQIFLVWFPATIHPDLTPNLHKKVFQEKLITSTLSSLTSLERRKSFLLYLQTVVEGKAEKRGQKKGKQEKDRRRKFLHRQSFVPIPLHEVLHMSMPPVSFFINFFVVTKTESKETLLLEIWIFQCIAMGSFTKRNFPNFRLLALFPGVSTCSTLQLLEANGAASQGPLRTVSRNPWKQSPKQNIEFWATRNPPTKIGWTTPHCYPKYEIWMIIFCEYSLYKHSFWPPVEYWISCRNHVEWHGTT